MNSPNTDKESSESGKALGWRDFAGLFAVSLAFAALLAWFITTPGYLDADYYYYGGSRLAQGYGFSEEILWNYLDGASSLPHPSHGYWGPLASMVAAAGMAVFGVGFRAAQLGFVLIAGLIGPSVAWFATGMGVDRRGAWLAGLLGVFSGFFAVCVSTIDNYGVLIVCGALLMGNLARAGCIPVWLLGGSLGLLLALMVLARIDSLLWVVLCLVALLMPQLGLLGADGDGRRKAYHAAGVMLAVFVLVIGPWFVRNMLVFGSPLGSGSTRVIFLTTYDDIFAWPASRLTMAAWLAQGWDVIASTIWEAVKTNIALFVVAQVGIANLMFFILGIIGIHKKPLVMLFLVGWVVLLLALAVVFPYPNGRGTFMHASSSFLALIPLLVVWGQQRLTRWVRPSALGVILLAGAVVTTGIICYQEIFQPGWNGKPAFYVSAEQAIQEQSGIADGEAVMAANPALYAIVNERPAIIIPNEPTEKLISLAQQFGVRYVVFDENFCRTPTLDLCKGTAQMDGLIRISQIGPLRVYQIPSND